MGWMMKNFNIFGVHEKIWFLEGVHEKSIYRGADCLKRGAWQEKGGGVLEGGNWYPNVHYDILRR